MGDESKPKLVYFDIKGRGEPIRLAFAGTVCHIFEQFVIYALTPLISSEMRSACLSNI
jgi:hypothetical protein